MGSPGDSRVHGRHRHVFSSTGSDKEAIGVDVIHERVDGESEGASLLDSRRGTAGGRKSVFKAVFGSWKPLGLEPSPELLAISMGESMFEHMRPWRGHCALGQL